MNRKAYPSDLTDPMWRPRDVDLREIVNAILYVLRSGCAWRMLPHDLPPWQTVKTTEVRGVRGFDGAKLKTGRKRHILVNVLGMLLAVYVHAANISEKKGGKTLLQRAKAKGFDRLPLIWADGGYNGQPFSFQRPSQGRIS